MSRQRSILAALIALAVATAASAADSKVLIEVDKSTQRMTVSVDGVPRWIWPISTGIRAYNTPSGKHQAFRMERDHFSKEWDDAPMPHSIFFTKRGHAIHGYLNTSRIGQPASHGCVRLEPENAAKLFALVESEGVLNTTVVIAGTLPQAAPAVARRPQPDGSTSAARRPAAPGYDQPPRYIDPRSAQPYDPRYAPPQYGQPYDPRTARGYDQRPYDPRYADPRYRDPRYADPRYRDPRYADPRYADESNYPPPPQRRRFLFFNVD
jgi:hypothetical protein